MLRRKVSLLLSILLTPMILWGQDAKKHAHWTYNLRKTKDNKYQLIFHLNLDKGWHVRAFSTENDSMLKAPSFYFNYSEHLTLTGKMEPKGIIENLKPDSVSHPINLYSYKVLYIQPIAAPKGTPISGTYTYQLCNDVKCFSPVTEKFKFKMKE